MAVLSIKFSIFTLMVVIGVLECSDNRDWRKHNAKVEMFTCRIPQARSFRWNELKVDKVLKDKEIISPSSTVLHRCESAGCCKENMDCLPLKQKTVKLTFALLADGREKTFFHVAATNHTECSCQVSRNQPK